jgi:hypothetical protein
MMAAMAPTVQRREDDAGTNGGVGGGDGATRNVDYGEDDREDGGAGEGEDPPTRAP